MPAWIRLPLASNLVSFLASASSSAMVRGGLLGSSPAALNISLFHTKNCVSYSCTKLQMRPWKYCIFQTQGNHLSCDTFICLNQGSSGWMNWLAAHSGIGGL